MTKSTYFVQECPKCGRSLHIRVEYLGKRVVCQHCRGQLLAADSEIIPRNVADSGLELLRRADELLETSDMRKSHPR